MAEEKIAPDDENIDTETMDAFRYIMHSVKGISPVSTVPELETYEISDEA